MPTTVQLVAVRIDDQRGPGVAVVQCDDDPPQELSWSLLHEAQQQDGPAGLVYRHLMGEFCLAAARQQQGQAWHSPRLTIEQIVADIRREDAREAAAADARRQKRARQEEAKRREQEREQEIRSVEAERARTAPDDPWWPIPSWEVPEGVRFDVPRRHQGQIVEISYGTFGRAEAASCDPYMHVYDRSDRSGRTYKRRSV